MIRRWIEKQMVAFEQLTDESADWMRDLYDTSPKAFFKFGLFRQYIAQHREALPGDAAAVASIEAIKREDCGPCLTTTVRFAEMGGVDHGIIAAAVARDLGALPAPLDGVYRFAEAVSTANPACDDLADELRGIYGDKGMVDLAFAIASARVFPTVKRALGHGRACYPVTIDGKMVPVGHAPEWRDDASHDQSVAAQPALA